MKDRLRDLEILNDTLKDTVSLEEFLTEHYNLEFEDSGSQLRALSPFNENDSDPSFYVHPEKQLYNCFSTGQGGDLIEFVRTMESLEYVDALRHIAELVNFDLTPFKTELTDDDKQERKLIRKNAKAQAHFSSHFDNILFESWYIGRAFDADILKKFGIGYCPRNNKMSLQPIRAKSVTIPLRSEYGDVMAFRSRPMDKGRGPKVFGPESSHPLSVPLIYGFHESKSSIRKEGYIILVEGEPDVWRMHEHGYTNTCATLGTKLPKEALQFLHSRKIDRIILLPDGDKAGREFAIRVAKSKIDVKVRISIAELPDGDPDDVLLDNPAIIKKALKKARHVIEFLVDEIVGAENPQTISQKLNALDELKPVLVGTDKATMDLACRHIGDRINMDPASIRDYFREESEDKPLYNTKGEQHVLGSIISSEEFRHVAVPHLRAEDFYLEKHKSIFKILQDLYGDHISVDVVATELANQGNNQLRSHLKHIVACADISAAKHQLDDIRDKSIRREATRISKEAIQRISQPGVEGSGAIEQLVADLASITASRTDVYSADTIVAERIQRFHQMVRNPTNITGFDLGPRLLTLNNAIHGLNTRRYFVSAAPSGVGKTSFALEIAIRCAVGLGIPTLFLTFETTRHTLIDRAISNLSGVPIQSFVTGQVTKKEAKLIQKYAGILKSSPLYFSEEGRSIEQSVALATSAAMKDGVQVVIFDYLQLMYSINSRKERLSRHLELGDISQQLLSLANRLDLSVLAIGQLNRMGAKSGVAAQGVDIGGSYTIYQDADIYLTLLEKSQDDMETYGLHLGNRLAKLNKNRIDGRNNIIFHSNLDIDRSQFIERADDET